MMETAKFEIVGKTFDRPSVEFSPERYVCYRASRSIKIDGDLEKPEWQSAEWTAAFVDIEGRDGSTPHLETRVKMLWDNEYFYVGARLEEPDLWANLTERDSVIYQDNDFEVFIDPDGDTHSYYEIEVNALGTIWDLMLLKPYRDGQRVAINTWNISGLKVGVHLDGTLNDPSTVDKGWSVELAIPWKALKESAPRIASPSDGDQWRVNFSRVEWKHRVVNGRYEKEKDPETGTVLPESNWVWSPQGLVNMHYPEMWGYVQFSSRISGTGKDVFRPHPDEEAKWALRNVYYSQKSWFLNHGSYSSDIDELALEDEGPAGYSWPPFIAVTPSLFEAIICAIDGSKTMHIEQDGKVWISTKE